jgi:hypothetical protein
MQRHVLGVIAILLLALSLQPASTLAQPLAQQPNNCRYFTETGGFYVCDEPASRFLSAFNRWGLQRIGYPISRRYIKDGFVTQAFQKAIMQWRPESNSVALVNIFDDLNNAGYNDVLFRTRQTPHQLPAGWDTGLSFPEVVSKRQALLNTRPALRTAYFAVGDPLTFYGLPTSEVTDMGNHYAVRLQRAVLQEWKENVPWARIGEVTVANGGDIAKELGALPAAALGTEPAGTVPAPPINAGSPGLPPVPPASGATPVPTATAVPSAKQFTGQIAQTFNNCSLTQVIGTVVDTSGNAVTGVHIRLWWPGGQTYHTTSGSYVRPETSASGWDFFLNEGNVANTWYIAVEDNNNTNLLSDPVTVQTANNCNSGSVNVAKLQITKNY